MKKAAHFSGTGIKSRSTGRVVPYVLIAILLCDLYRIYADAASMSETTDIPDRKC